MKPNRLIPILLILIILAFLAMALAAQPLGASDTVYITRTGAKYHRGTCSCLRKSKIKTTREDAEKRGYEPCKLCRP